MGGRDDMTADEWERSRMAPNDMDKKPHAQPSRPPQPIEQLIAEQRETNKLLVALLAEQRQTNKILVRLGVAITKQAASAQPSQQAANQRGPAIASDRDLDGERGNPRLKFDPRDWKGEPCVNRQMSECPPEYLDMLAENLEWQANNPRKDPATGAPNEKDVKAARFKLLDAARARGWAKRIREGWCGAPAANSGSQSGGGGSQTEPDVML